MTLEKEKFLQIVREIVEGFEKPEFQEGLKAAKAEGDIQKLITLPMSLQTGIFATHGLDPVGGMALFKEAGKRFGLEPEAAPLMERMKKALAVLAG